MAFDMASRFAGRGVERTGVHFTNRHLSARLTRGRGGPQENRPSCLIRRSADAATPRANRGAKNQGNSRLPAFWIDTAAPLTPSLARGSNFGNKLLAAHALWPDESGFRAGGQPRGRGHHARAGVKGRLCMTWSPCYHACMIRSFKDAATEDTFNGVNSKAARKACPRSCASRRAIVWKR